MDVFQQVKDQLAMRDVLQHYGVEVNGAGFALCPFHDDRRASMKVYKNSFYCFSCGVGGDLIKFAAMLKGTRNIDACRELAAAFGIPVDDQGGTAQPSFRAKYMREKRERERRDAERLEREAQHANLVLSAMMRYLNHGKYAHEYPDVEHVRALQMHAECEYFCECLDSDPRGFLATNRGVVDRYEATVNRWYSEEQAP